MQIRRGVPDRARPGHRGETIQKRILRNKKPMGLQPRTVRGRIGGNREVLKKGKRSHKGLGENMPLEVAWPEGKNAAGHPCVDRIGKEKETVGLL